MSVGYGLDVWCDADGLRTGRYVTGWRLVAQAIVRRLITPQGTLRGGSEESAYGYDIRALIGAVGYRSAVLALPGFVEAQILKDDRVDSATVVPALVTEANGSMSIELAITVTLADENQSFALTLSATEAAVQVKYLEAA